MSAPHIQTINRSLMLKVRDRVDVTIYRDPGAYVAHPCVALLASGDLLVAFNETLPPQPWLHAPLVTTLSDRYVKPEV